MEAPARQLKEMMKMNRLMVFGFLAIANAASAASLEEGLELKKQQKLAEAESVFAAVVAERPDDAAALEQWATVLGWLGRFDDAIAAWRRALEQKPENPRYVTGLARVLYWKGELAPARARLDALLAAAPDDTDALTLAGDVCSAQRDVACARSDYARAQALAPSAELSRKLANAVEPPRFRLDGGGVLDGYNTDRGLEGSFFLQGSWQALAELVLSAGYEQLHQFGAVDHRANAGFFLHPFAALLLNGRVAISPTADTIAPWEASGGADLSIAGPVTGTAMVRHLDFPNQGVTIFGAGARLDFERTSIVLQGGLVYSTAADLQGYGLGRLERALGENWRAYVGLSYGAQAQLLLPTATATDVVAGVQWQIDPTWAVRLDYTYEKYGDFYTRNSIGSALTCKF
jgi:YaiO family outer membrane protein